MSARHDVAAEGPMDDLEQWEEKAAAGKSVRLSEKDAREAARLLAILLGHRNTESLGAIESKLAPEREQLLRKAREIFSGRRNRRKHFNRAMFDEPAWDIVLALYIAEFREARLTISRIADWIEVPTSTAVRWIDYLEKQRLIERQPHPNDKRISFLRLLDRGRAAMDTYLSELIATPQGPLD
jgi:DNA-binding MarR family transcriptional regulator